MDAIWAPLGIGLAALLIVALGVAWWEHRQRLAEVQRRLEDSEQSRFMLEQQAGEMDARLLALSEALAARPPEDATGDGDQAQRAATLSTAMQRMSGAPPAASAIAAAAATAATGHADESSWQETQPMVLKPTLPVIEPFSAGSATEYAPTMPAPLDLLTPPR